MMDMLFCQEEAQKVQASIPWLLALQHQGLDELKQLGFPKIKDEDWRYTKLDSLLGHRFSSAQKTAASGAQPLNKTATLPYGSMIHIRDGLIEGLDALQDSLPPGMIVQSLMQAAIEHPEKVRAHLGQALQIRHGFQAQNAAMLNLGLFIYLPQGMRLQQPIVCVHYQSHSDQASYLRHLIVAESGASLSFVEDYQGEDKQVYLTNTITEIFAKQQARIQHYKIQRESHEAFHIGHMAIEQAADSQVHSHLLNLGARLSRSDICAYLRAPHGFCELNGIYAPQLKQHMDQHTWIYHNAEACDSRQDYKGILGGQSRAVFNGQIHVAPLAQKTVAKQQNKNLLLSKNAEIDTKPQLDIAADDVMCTHGATVGQLDTDALFYFTTRGISQKEATQYLIQAFAADNLQALADETLMAWMGGLLNQQLGLEHDA